MLNRIKNTKQRKSDGFTIIEVMIVLAIAGLILLIVFLAVPALQRNSRNTQRKNDVSAILAAVNDYSTNNNGLLPSNATLPTYAGGILTINPDPPATATATAHVGFYQSGIGAAQGKISLGATGSVVAAGTFNNSAHDYVEIIPGARCNTTATVAQNRTSAIVYEVETGAGTYSQQCTDS